MKSVWFALMTAMAVGVVTATAGAARSPLVAAHRGGAQLWPENSLLAFRGALELGVDFVETDVHLTADGEVLVLHDATLDRTTTGKGAVRERTLAEIRAARLRGPDKTPTEEPVPTLAQLLDLVRASRVELLLEIKVGSGRRYDGIEEKALALVRSRNLLARTIVMAFESETVRRVRQLDPTVRTALLVGRRQVERGARPASAVAKATELGASHLGMDHRILDADVVAAAQKAGIQLAAWTVNEEIDIRRVVSLGAGIVISDRPDLALRLVGR